MGVDDLKLASEVHVVERFSPHEVGGQWCIKWMSKEYVASLLLGGEWLSWRSWNVFAVWRVRFGKRSVRDVLCRLGGRQVVGKPPCDAGDVVRDHVLRVEGGDATRQLFAGWYVRVQRDVILYVSLISFGDDVSCSLRGCEKWKGKWCVLFQASNRPNPTTRGSISKVL